MAKSPPILLNRVIKLGGSLLGEPKTPTRISRWLEKQLQAEQASPNHFRNIWIVGGGALVNTIRDWDSKFKLEPKATHWICVDLMDINSRLMSAWFPDWPVSNQSNQFTNTQNQIFQTSQWLRQFGSGLPESWQTTSDAIAAAFADFIDARELVLLKSCNPPRPISLDTLDASDYVDDQFVSQLQSFRGQLNLRLVDLSTDEANEASLALK